MRVCYFSLSNHSWLYSETEKYNGKNETHTKNVQVLKAMHTQQLGALLIISFLVRL